MDRIDTLHLFLFCETGSVYLKVDDGDDERIGHIDDCDSCPWEHVAEWDWLAAEMEDRRRFADACERTVLASYYERLSPSHWN